jgi:hypothetical protein
MQFLITILLQNVLNDFCCFQSKSKSQRIKFATIADTEK